MYTSPKVSLFCCCSRCRHPKCQALHLFPPWRKCSNHLWKVCCFSSVWFLYSSKIQVWRCIASIYNVDGRHEVCQDSRCTNTQFRSSFKMFFGFRETFGKSVWLLGEVKSVESVKPLKGTTFHVLCFDRRLNCVCKGKCSPSRLDTRELEQMNEKITWATALWNHLSLICIQHIIGKDHTHYLSVIRINKKVLFGIIASSLLTSFSNAPLAFWTTSLSVYHFLKVVMLISLVFSLPKRL